MIAADIMTRSVVVTQADSLLNDAVHLMLEHRISGLPVVDGSGNLVGMLTETDLLRRTETGTEAGSSWLRAFFHPGQIAEDFAHAHGRRVSEVMSSDVASIVETTSIRDIVTLLQARHINRVPVLRGRYIVGIVARADLVWGLGSILDARHTPLHPAIDDLAIRARLQSALDQAAWAPKGITFTVTDGRVHLYGSVADDRDRRAVQVAAENVPGAVSVTDHLVDAKQDPYAYLRPDGPGPTQR